MYPFSDWEPRGGWLAASGPALNRHEQVRTVAPGTGRGCVQGIGRTHWRITKEFLLTDKYVHICTGEDRYTDIKQARKCPVSCGLCSLPYFSLGSYREHIFFSRFI